jgi:hypothetical protein
MASKSDARPATQDLIDSIRGAFQRYTRETRHKAWYDGVNSAQGKNAIEKLIKNPKVPIIGVYKFLKFKEWLENS